MAKTYLIVGGVAGGAGVAARLRRLDESANIVMFEQGPYISYANCGLPYYAGGVIAQRDRLFVITQEKFHDVFNIDVQTNTKVTSIDRAAKSVKTQDGRTFSYDALVLSTGSVPYIPSIPGIDDPAVATVRNVVDIDNVVKRLDGGIRKAVVIGGGFIGIEMAENLRHRKLDVTIVEAAPQCMTNLDPDMVTAVHQELRANGIHLLLDSPLETIQRVGEHVAVTTKNGSIEGVDLVVLSIGVRPDSFLAKDAGLQLGSRGHISVDQCFRTSDPSIYAIGDVVEYPSPITGKMQAIPLAGPANKMARLCADAIVNNACRKYDGTYGAAIAQVFSLGAGSVGMNSRQLDQEHIAYDVAVVHVQSNASYYPGARPLAMKLLYAPQTGKILGFQAVGGACVDKHIDVVSSVMHGSEGTVASLAEFEQAYAPPFNSAKDGLNMLGFIAQNNMDGLDTTVTYLQAQQLVDQGAFLLDVRTPDEFALGTIEHAVNIPYEHLREHLDEIPTGKKLVVMCASGHRSHVACRILRQHGWSEVFNVTGGYKTWNAVREEQQEGNTMNTAQPAVAAGEQAPQATALTLDACGLQCPGPIVQLKKQMDSMALGQQLVVKASDPGFANDAKSWCAMTGNTLESLDQVDGIITAVITKGEAKATCSAPTCAKGATLIVFSNDFDKALASFVLANGAAASGKEVTMFFTFWGLSLLRRKPNKRVRKDFMGKMFGAMLPKDMEHLKLSSMNFAGMGPKMMKSRMKAKNVAQLRQMYEQAKDAGVRFIACQMSMDIMGVAKEELLDGVEIGGVGTYMAHASNSDVNLFI